MSGDAPSGHGGPTPRSLIPLFFLSGISGLVYEVVWVRMLIRAFGVTIYAVSTVLVVFMTGLALGSFIAGRKLKQRHRLLRTYALTEVAIGVTAFLSTLLILALPSIVRELTPLVGTSGFAMTVARFVLSAVALLPPTLLMGATLPMLSGYLAADPATLGRRVGLLYGVNTLGAVFGVLGTGLFSIMLIGETWTVFSAAALNLLVGALAFSMARRSPMAPAEAAPPPETADAPPPGEVAPRVVRNLMVIYGVSGLAALGYQVIWSRMLTLVLGNSVYAFSLTLAAYLLGIGIGSLVMAQIAERISRPLLVLGALEMLLAVLALGSLHVFEWLGRSPANTGATYSQLESAADFPRIGFNALLIVLPVTLVLGALFPLVAKLCASGGGFTQETVGKLYGMNTVGSIVGSFVSGFVLIPYLGTLRSFLLLATISFVIGVWVFFIDTATTRRPLPRVPLLAGSLAFVVALSFSFEDSFLNVLKKGLTKDNFVVLHVEDKSATITAVESETKMHGEPWRHLFINGILTSSTDLETGNLMIFMPLLYHPDPQRSLLVGLGVGEAFRASLDMKLDTTVVDLVPSIAEFFKFYHPTDHEKYLSDPKGRIVVNDGRNFLLTTREKFDFVFVDGTPPLYSSGTVNLYSREFTALVKDHLTSNGIFTLWFPTYCFESDFWVVARNFVDLFPHVTLWAAPGMSGILLAGTNSKAPIFDVDREVLDQRVQARMSPRRPGIGTPRTSESFMILSEAAIRNEAAKYPPLTDDRPYTEFPLLNFMAKKPYHKDSKFLLPFADRRQIRAASEGASGVR